MIHFTGYKVDKTEARIVSTECFELNNNLTESGKARYLPWLSDLLDT